MIQLTSSSKGAFRKSCLLKPIVASVMAATSFATVAIAPAAMALPDNLLRDTVIGAGTNAAVGGLTNNGNLLENAVGGAAAGAAVSATHNPNNDGIGGVVQDAAVGAAASAVTGALLNNGSAGNNAIGGAATGVLINVSQDWNLF